MKITDVDGLISALCDAVYGEGEITEKNQARIRAIVPRFIVQEDEPLDVMQIMARNINVDDLKEWLTDHEYDGLWNEEGDPHCGCSLDDLYCGDGCPYPDCRPAYKYRDGNMYLKPEEV